MNTDNPHHPSAHYPFQVLLEKMDDLQLAMIVARLYEADFESSSTCQGLLYEKVLGCNRDGGGYHCSRLHPDPFLRSIAFWIMKDYTRALDTLLERIPKEEEDNQGQPAADSLVAVIGVPNKTPGPNRTSEPGMKCCTRLWFKPWPVIMLVVGGVRFFFI